MRSDSVWNMSALLTRITRQVSRTFDLNFAAISSKISFFCTRPRISRSLYYHRRFQDPSFKQFYFLHPFFICTLYILFLMLLH